MSKNRSGEYAKTSDRFDEILEHPLEFLEQVSQLKEDRSASEEDWDKLLYQDWFVCPRKQMGEFLEISLWRQDDFDKKKRPRGGEIVVYVTNSSLTQDDCDGGRRPVTAEIKTVIREAVEAQEGIWGPKVAIRFLSEIKGIVEKEIAKQQKRSKE